MQLNHISGNSYYLDGESAVGVYVFPDHSCLLVDSGPGEARSKKIMDVLKREGLEVYAIFNTHGHADHCGGNAYIQAASQCTIISSALSAAVIENPILGPAMLYSAEPLRVLKNRVLMPQPSKVGQIIQSGSLQIRDKEFTVLDLPGHGIGHLGLVNPDGVAFLGDSLMHEEIIRTYPFLYLVDIQSQLETLAYLEQQCWPQVFLTHGGLLDDFQQSVRSNQERIHSIIVQIMAIIERSSSREQVVAEMIDQLNLNVNTGQYYLVSSTISAFISYLCKQKKLRNKVENGIMKFSRCSI